VHAIGSGTCIWDCIFDFGAIFISLFDWI
jgi:hypothetical protein